MPVEVAYLEDRLVIFRILDWSRNFLGVEHTTKLVNGRLFHIYGFSGKPVYYSRLCRTVSKLENGKIRVITSPDVYLRTAECIEQLKKCLEESDETLSRKQFLGLGKSAEKISNCLTLSLDVRTNVFDTSKTEHYAQIVFDKGDNITFVAKINGWSYGDNYGIRLQAINIAYHGNSDCECLFLKNK
jgi:hypothetical protein